MFACNPTLPRGVRGQVVPDIFLVDDDLFGPLTSTAHRQKRSVGGTGLGGQVVAASGESVGGEVRVSADNRWVDT